MANLNHKIKALGDIHLMPNGKVEAFAEIKGQNVTLSGEITSPTITTINSNVSTNTSNIATLQAFDNNLSTSLTTTNVNSNNNLTIESKGGGNILLKTNNINRVSITDTGSIVAQGGLEYNNNTNTLTAGTFSGNLLGNANTATNATNASFAANAINAIDSANATNVGTTFKNDNVTYYPTFVQNTSGNNPICMDMGLTYNALTDTLTTTTFSGNLSGTATNATNATNAINATNATNATNSTNAINVAITANGTNASFYPCFVSATSGNNPINVDSSGLTYNPSNNTLTAGTFSGSLSGNASTATSATNSTNATNVAVSSTNTNASYYPCFVSSTTGNQPISVDSGGLSYNPATNTLTTGILSSGIINAGTTIQSLGDVSGDTLSAATSLDTPLIKNSGGNLTLEAAAASNIKLNNNMDANTKNITGANIVSSTTSTASTSVSTPLVTNTADLSLSAGAANSIQCLNNVNLNTKNITNIGAVNSATLATTGNITCDGTIISEGANGVDFRDATGVTTYGTIKSNATRSTVQFNANQANGIDFTSTDTNAPIVTTLYNRPGGTLSNDIVGRYNFYANDTGGTQRQLATIIAYSSGAVTTAAAAGRLDYLVTRSGTLTTARVCSMESSIFNIWGTDAVQPINRINYYRSTGTFTDVDIGKTLFRSGASTSTLYDVAQMRCVSKGTPSATSIQSALVFSTGGASSGSMVDAMTILDNQSVVIGNTVSNGARLSVTPTSTDTQGILVDCKNSTTGCGFTSVKDASLGYDNGAFQCGAVNGTGNWFPGTALGDGFIRLSNVGASTTRKLFFGVNHSTTPPYVNNNNYLILGNSTNTTHQLAVLRAGQDVGMFESSTVDSQITVKQSGGKTAWFYLNATRCDIGTDTGTMRCYSNFAPWANSTYDLGSTTLRWNNIYLINSPNVSSDERLKENIVDLDLGLDFIKSLRPVKYNLKAVQPEKPDCGENDLPNPPECYDGKERMGFIAQEVKEVIGDRDLNLWDKEDNAVGLQSLRYTELISPMIKSIQELSQMVKDLQAEITILKSK